MTRKNLKREQALRVRAAQLRLAPAQREAIAVEVAAEPIEQCRLDAERDLAIQYADRSSRLMREVERALGRLQDGSYGICVVCEEPIAAKRLDALPWAARCLGCQEQWDARAPSADFRFDTLAA